MSFLEANADYVACAHNTIKIYEDDSKGPHRFLYWDDTKADHTIDDFVAMTSFFHTSSILYRNVLKGIPPRQFRSKWSCDIFNTMAHVRHGKLRYFNKDMSTYRSHKGGNFSRMSETRGRIFNIEGLRRYNRWLGYRYLTGFSYTLYRLCDDLLKQVAAGTLGPISHFERLKYSAIRGFYGGLFEFLTKHPKCAPSYFWYGERPPSRKKKRDRT